MFPLALVPVARSRQLAQGVITMLTQDVLVIIAQPFRVGLLLSDSFFYQHPYIQHKRANPLSYDPKE